MDTSEIIWQQLLKDLRLFRQRNDKSDIPYSDYAVITVDNNGHVLSNGAWEGKHYHALIRAEFLDEYYGNVDDPLEVGDTIDIGGLIIDLIDYDEPRLLWIASKVKVN